MTMPSTMVDSPGSVRMMSAAARAASVAKEERESERQEDTKKVRDRQTKREWERKNDRLRGSVREREKEKERRIRERERMNEWKRLRETEIEKDSKKVVKGGKRKRKRGERHLIMYNVMNILKTQRNYRAHNFSSPVSYQKFDEVIIGQARTNTYLHVQPHPHQLSSTLVRHWHRRLSFQSCTQVPLSILRSNICVLERPTEIIVYSENIT